MKPVIGRMCLASIWTNPKYKRCWRCWSLMCGIKLLFLIQKNISALDDDIATMAFDGRRSRKEQGMFEANIDQELGSC